ncbi:tRNA (adenosine(37)-N6)-dimethylallyltransferase MiaA [Candidatus Odyssella thessalonicensis]
MRVLILTGPTASGKTALALELAHQLNGEIINADSMQLYRHLPVLTACPTVQEKKEIPHHLYEILGDHDLSSAGWWVSQAVHYIDQLLERGRVPILVGGTGLYLRSLTSGISPIPEIPSSIREEARRLAQAPSFHEIVFAFDPMVRGKLKENDRQRLSRAWEVKMATGRSIIEWQQEKSQALPYEFQKIALVPARSWLHNRINARFDLMMSQGALEEVQALKARPLRPDSPLLRAVGVKELSDYLNGQTTLEQAIELAKIATRQYAKRQLTWLRGQAQDYEVRHVGA